MQKHALKHVSNAFSKVRNNLQPVNILSFTNHAPDRSSINQLKSFFIKIQFIIISVLHENPEGQLQPQQIYVCKIN